MSEYIEREDQYDKIGSIVEQWCKEKENMYTTMLVTISIGYDWEEPHEETHVLEWDCENHCLVWEVDWWEGQQHVELVGFAPTYTIRLVGADAEVAPVVRCKDCKHGTRLVCDLAGNEYIECRHGNIARRLDFFCADGAKMDKEDTNG